MAKNNEKTNKLGLPIHIGPKTKTLMRERIAMVEKIVETGKSLKTKRPLNKKDLAYAKKHLSAYRWQMKTLEPKKSTKKRAS
jgi:hypothetical protein